MQVLHGLLHSVTLRRSGMSTVCSPNPDVAFVLILAAGFHIYSHTTGQRNRYSSSLGIKAEGNECFSYSYFIIGFLYPWALDLRLSTLWCYHPPWISNLLPTDFWRSPSQETELKKDRTFTLHCRPSLPTYEHSPLTHTGQNISSWFQRESTWLCTGVSSSPFFVSNLPSAEGEGWSIWCLNPTRIFLLSQWIHWSIYMEPSSPITGT